MLRSLYSGISGLRAHQTMLDVTGNNIANVNTQGFKASSVQFEDTLSQMTKGASGPQGGNGGTNPAQVGLGVQVAGIATNFTQGSSQTTGKNTDMMISGDGFFISKQGTETLYTRSGSLSQDPQGRLVTPDGAIVQGWMAGPNGTITGGPVRDMVLSTATLAPAAATTKATVGGNLPGDAAVPTTLVKPFQVYDATGNASTVNLTFTHTAAGSWNVSDGAGGTATLNFANGQPTAGSSKSMTIGGVAVDLSTVTGFTGMSTVTANSVDGGTAGTLQSFSLAKDGTIMGAFSNGSKQAVGRIALANFTNPEGLEKAGSSSYRTSANSGTANVGTAGAGGLGTLLGGQLEMSNVDLSQEFTNLIVAQRGFQANARTITTSDQILQELIDLKR
ncbi:flagellar hook protein FlgE [Paenarthrobacter sp. Z7-10]|uniref:flagellar hook protein FlgE n=1 Tax=Paenarthrobacter sp. Z7-10 TaxID=2787635 RepID=UPI0022A9E780|nr:flagellar hook protein FlgE [Paenarthrobacter sp. Z7-10]MCZ2403312.1 flagellar hook protein FlgE [Paenarthrobacter sp. Z7-10]